jgi:crossover junction endodeoxyribonuclease RuvC
MRTLGIDPGISAVGWGVVEEKNGNPGLVAYGCISTFSSSSFPEKLGEIARRIAKIILEYKPSAVSIEEPFFARDAKTSLRIGEVVGAIMLCALNTGIEVAGYSVSEIKQAVVGFGRADKKQVQNMVKVLLRLDKVPQPYDAADALAAAICHQNSRGVISSQLKR